jgi:hypothetical protein
MSSSIDGIPVLKRLTALEPEMELPPAESPTFEISESSGNEADMDTSVSETETETETEEQELSVESTAPVGFRVEMPAWIWISVLVLWFAYMWGIAYALTPVRNVYP